MLRASIRYAALWIGERPTPFLTAPDGDVTRKLHRSSVELDTVAPPFSLRDVPLDVRPFGAALRHGAP